MLLHSRSRGSARTWTRRGVLTLAALAAGALGGACNGGSSGGAGGGAAGAGGGCGDTGGYDCFCDDGEFTGGACIDGEFVCDPCPPAPDISCGPGSGKTCSGGQFCYFADGKCGTGATVGRCMDPHDGCYGSFATVCGCDGVARDTECANNDWGLDVSTDGACAVDGKHFSCGAEICDRATDFCRTDVDQFGEHDTPGACITNPMCSPATCACVMAAGFAGCDCTEAADGIVRIACP